MRSCTEGNTAKGIQARLESTTVPAGEWLRVKSVFPRGAAEVLVVLGDEASKNRMLSGDTFKVAGLEAREMRGRRRRMLFTGVKRTHTPEVVEEIRKNNFPEIVDFLDKFKLVFRTGRRDGDQVSCVAEVHPDLKKNLKAQGSFYFGWTSV